MRSDASDIALRDIQHHIELAIEFTSDLTENEFKADLRTVYAVTRCLGIISEASRRVSEDVKRRHGSVPCKQIAGSGNVYRHDYEDVAAQMIWDTVHRALPGLKAVVMEELARSG
ncbi:MAG: DUF86 domain-containing protein [Rhodopseudomonas sp.]|uniref:HepT-like ribonuclease domain-containing protein n=1 Tax=Rhodopseudomonas sp. TaxID=1078 RepID=UPI0039E508BC